MSRKLRVARAALHFWEEPCISGEYGSGAIFFSGCSMRCAFCQNWQISHDLRGKDIDSYRLAEIFGELAAAGAHNINLVTPDHYMSAIIESLNIYRPNIPIVWNCSGYLSQAAVRKISPYIDVFLPDLKFSNSLIAARYCAHSDYFEVASRSIKLMREIKGPAKYAENGIIQQGVLVRHLILPNAMENSLEIIDFLADLPPDTPVSVMAQYTPCGNIVEFPELQRKITASEYQIILQEVFNKDLDGWVQEMDSADSGYIPIFDNSGV